MSKKKSFSELLKEVGDSYNEPLIQVQPGELVVRKEFMSPPYGNSDNINLYVVVTDRATQDDNPRFRGDRAAVPQVVVGTMNPRNPSLTVMSEELARFRKATPEDLAAVNHEVVTALKADRQASTPISRFRNLLLADE